MKKKNLNNPAKQTKGKKLKRKIVSFSFRNYWQIQPVPIKFLTVFLLCIGIFYWMYNFPIFINYFVIPVTNTQAQISNWVLNLLGQNTWIDQGIIYTEKVALSIKAGCDGIEPLAFFIIGVLLVPLSWKSKVVGLFIGSIILLFLNLIRILGLFFAKVYWESSFDLLHTHGGFSLFFILTIIIWMIWAKWAIQISKPQINVIND